jgi:hypothetical protein
VPFFLKLTFKAFDLWGGSAALKFKILLIEDTSFLSRLLANYLVQALGQRRFSFYLISPAARVYSLVF